jgi:iron complex transport system ATP-binding protein
MGCFKKPNCLEMQNAGKEMVKIQNLSIGYPGQMLFENLNLSLYPGQLVCFMGPNGAGKSTLIRTIAGLQKAISGTIVFDGQDGKHRDLIQQEIALVLTDPVKEINMTVYEVITFGRYPYLNWNLNLSEKDLSFIHQAMQKVNIEKFADKKLHQLSDGQLQMVMVARAIAQDTPVIILDEPTAHLDLNNRVEIMRLLHQLTRVEGKTILLATHELDLALQTSDLIWLTGNSKNIITGLPEDLVLNGAFDETFKFKGFDLKTGKVQHIPFRKVIIQLHGDGYFYLWTKNALERNGYSVISESAGFSVEIVNKNNEPQWELNSEHTFNSLSTLINYLQLVTS